MWIFLFSFISFLHFLVACLFVCLIFGLKCAEVQVKVEQETALRTETKKVKELEEKVRILEQELETRKKHERSASHSVCLDCFHPHRSSFFLSFFLSLQLKLHHILELLSVGRIA
jgi:hypothetical protein